MVRLHTTKIDSRREETGDKLLQALLLQMLAKENHAHLSLQLRYCVTKQHGLCSAASVGIMSSSYCWNKPIRTVIFTQGKSDLKMVCSIYQFHIKYEVFVSGKEWV
jgi:hypothetical protein